MAGCRGVVLVLALAWTGLVVAGPAGRQDGSGPAAEGGTVVLTTGSYWRAFAACRPAVVPVGLVGEEDRQSASARQLGPVFCSAGPPTNWMAVDFDDSSWPRHAGPFTGGKRVWAHAYACEGRSLICLRGKFRVTDPRAVGKLTLELSFSGGVIVYLNGKEVLRAHLPAGKVTPETPAEPYPKDAYVGPDGKLLPRANRVPKDAAELKRRIALRRSRRAGPVELPRALLRKGVNVLAIGLHRAAPRPEAIRAAKKKLYWEHVALWSVRLWATGGGVVPNVARPPGWQLWNADPHQVISLASYGDPNEPLRPIKLVGPRNGYCSGQVILSRDSALEDIRATATALRRVDGGGEIAAKDVLIRYAIQGTLDLAMRRDGLGLAYASWTRVPVFAALVERPPRRVEPKALKTDPRKRRALGLPLRMKPAAVQPIWVTVHVPADVPPGLYRGTVSVSARGVPAAAVPVELKVLDWTLPEMSDYLTTVCLYQSPETLAAHYGVAMWSDEHFALLEKSWQLQGWLGNNLLVIPLVNQTMFGNDECYVPWVKNGDGTFRYDFTAYERLVKLARKYCDIRFISYQVYRPKGWTPPGADAPNSVAVIDPTTGEKSTMRLPAFGTPEALKLWRPLMRALKAEHRKLGLAEGVTIVLGIAQDGGVDKRVVQHFKELWPKVRWHYAAHNRPRRWRQKRLYDLAEYLYVPDLPLSPDKRRYGWQEPCAIMMSQRVHDHSQPIMMVRTMAERALLLGDDGPGRFCLDYWPVKGVRGGSHGGTMFSRWPESTATQRTPHLKRLSYPGPEGAIPSIKAVMFREGLQEAEARNRIERALVAGKLSEPLARRCREVLDRRLEFLRLYHWPRWFTYASDRTWQGLSEELFQLAYEVAKELEGK